jgi:hypothetical protein
VYAVDLVEFLETLFRKFFYFFDCCGGCYVVVLWVFEFHPVYVFHGVLDPFVPQRLLHC